MHNIYTFIHLHPIIVLVLASKESNRLATPICLSVVYMAPETWSLCKYILYMVFAKIAHRGLKLHIWGELGGGIKLKTCRGRPL